MHNITIGQPVKTLPGHGNARIPWEEIRSAVDSAEGAWVPIEYPGSTRSRLSQNVHKIKHGQIKTFRQGVYEATQRDGKLWIRKTA